MLHCRLADISGPFYDQAKPFRNWSSLPFYQLDLPHAPYVDQQQLARGVARACAHLTNLKQQGYSGIVIDNLAHLVSFADAPVAIYAPNDPFAQRAAIYGAAFGQLFEAAAQHGMDVLVATDMQWSTPPVRAYVGALAAHNPRLALVNQWALAEVFARFPQVRGVVVRTGETGGAHNQGSDYAGHMIYTSVADLRHLIGTVLAACAAHERLLVLRTWSLGIGETGDLLWSAARYRAVFQGFPTQHLLASIKHAPSDFFRLMPHNPTIGLPGPRQIIELQNRREYELFGMVPSSVAALHGAALQHAAAFPQVIGISVWNATGGWGGGRAALGADGWNEWTQLNSALSAALARDPWCDSAALLDGWCEERYGPAFGPAVAALFHESAALIERGWYQGPLDHAARTLGGVHMPSLLWVWWTRPTAAPLVWAYLAACTDSATTRQDGAAALAQLALLVKHLEAAAPAGDARVEWLVCSARYFHDALAVAQALRNLLLPLYAAAHAGDRQGWRTARAELAGTRQVLAQHQRTWGSDQDFPALELAEIEQFLEQLAAAPWLAWLKARAACVLVQRAQHGRLPGRFIYGAGVGAMLALAYARRSPTIGAVGLASALFAVPGLRARAARVALPWLNARLNLLPTMFFEAGPSLAEWAE